MYKTARNLTVLGVGLGASAVIGWFLLREAKRHQDDSPLMVKSHRRQAEPEEVQQIVVPLETADVVAQEAMQTSAQTEDDLTLIKDIGPRFADALRAIGITEFSQLAEETPESLSERLSDLITVRAQRIQTNNWIGQAAELAAK